METKQLKQQKNKQNKVSKATQTARYRAKLFNRISEIYEITPDKVFNKDKALLNFI